MVVPNLEKFPLGVPEISSSQESDSWTTQKHNASGYRRQQTDNKNNMLAIKEVNRLDFSMFFPVLKNLTAPNKSHRSQTALKAEQGPSHMLEKKLHT